MTTSTRKRRQSRSQNPGAIRQDRYRHRQSIGRVCLSVEVDEILFVSALLDTHTLDDARALDASAVAAAASTILMQWATQRQKR